MNAGVAPPAINFINCPVPSAAIILVLLKVPGVVMLPIAGMVRLKLPRVNILFCNTIPTPALLLSAKACERLTPAGLFIVMVVPIPPQVVASPVPVTCAVVPLYIRLAPLLNVRVLV